MEKLTAQELGTRLRAAREAVGLTQQEVARRLGLKSHQSVLRMETGERQVSTLEFAQLARLYGRPMSYFISPEGYDLNASVALPHAGELATADLEAITWAVERCRHLAFLCRVLGRSPGRLSSLRFEVPPPRDQGQATDQAERAARWVRDALDLGLQPTLNLPRLVEEQGIGLFRVELSTPNVTGVSLVQPPMVGCILVNTGDRPERQLLTIAHEFFHLLVDHSPSVCFESADRENLMHLRAERFAWALLMPRDGLDRYRQDVLQVSWQELDAVHAIQLQYHFLVGYQTLVVWLRRLGFIGEAHLERLLLATPDRLARLCHYDPNTAFPTSMAFEQRLRAMAVEAYREGKISRGRLADILGIDELELSGLLRDLGVVPSRVPARRGRNPLLVAEGAR